MQPYFPDAAAPLLHCMAPLAVRQPQLPAPEAAPSSSSHTAAAAAAAAEGPEPAALAPRLLAADMALQAAKEAAAAALAASVALSGLTPSKAPPLADETPQHMGSPAGGPPLAPPPAQQGPGTPSPLALAAAGGVDGSSGGGGAAQPPRLRLPPGLQGVEPSLPERDLAPVGVVPSGGGAVVALFPARPGQPVCEFYRNTGHCRCACLPACLGCGAGGGQSCVLGNARAARAARMHAPRQP